MISHALNYALRAYYWDLKNLQPNTPDKHYSLKWFWLNHSKTSAAIRLHPVHKKFAAFP